MGISDAGWRAKPGGLCETARIVWPLDLGLTAVLFVRRWRSRRWQSIRLNG